MGTKYTYDYVKDFIENNSNCKLISDTYNGNKSCLTLKCECDRVFNVSFNHFKTHNQRKCKVCSGNKLDYDIVNKFIESKKCKLISKTYKNNSSKLDIKCVCGDIFSVDFNTFKKGQIRCKKCYWKENKHYNKHTYENVKKYIESNSDCKLISNSYVGIFDKLDLLCDCGKMFKRSFNSIKNTKNLCCNDCSRILVNSKNTHDLEYIHYAVSKKYGDDIRIIDMDYIGTRHTTAIVIHKCGCKFSKNINRLLYTDIKCPKCMIGTSVGISKILKFLNDNNISYIREYMFNDCSYIRKLRFDIFVPQYNLCIEYDGEQHYKIVDYFGGLDGFIKTKIRDTIKNEYCKNNNINLVRIPYNKINKIDIILSPYLNKKLIPR